MKDYTIKDSGKRQTYKSGAVRDTNEGKIRYDLLPIECLKRLAEHYTKGAKKYDDNNWKKGIPTKRFIESTWRHWGQYLLGRVFPEDEAYIEEDHLSAIVFNVFGIMFNEESNPGLTKEQMRRLMEANK